MIFDVISFLQDYSIDHSFTGKNVQEGWVSICCPNCSDHSDHGGFNIDGGYYYCWRCGGNKISYIIKLLLNCSYSESIYIYNSYCKKYSINGQLKKRDNAIKVFLPGSKSLLKIDKKYLIKRNFDPEYIKNKYQIKGSDIVGEWSFRIIIPVFYKKKLVSFQGRDVTENEDFLKYKSLSVEKSVIDIKHIFYDMDNIDNSTICIVEGVIDKWRMGKNVIASFGKTMSDYQIRLLIKNKYKRIFFLIDCNDPESKKFARKYSAVISGFDIECIIFDMENEKDPGELDEKEVLYIRREMGI